MTDRDAKLVDIACFVRTETPRAYLIGDGHREVWVPKSQVEMHDEGKSHVCVMPYWMAHEKGLI